MTPCVTAATVAASVALASTKGVDGGGSVGGGGDGAMSTARPALTELTPHVTMGSLAEFVMVIEESALTNKRELSVLNTASLVVVTTAMRSKQSCKGRQEERSSGCAGVQVVASVSGKP